MNKAQKEKWIVEQFLKSYNKKLENSILDPKPVPTTMAAGPDFIAQCKNGNRIGIEVTELLEYPSEITGQQRHLGRHFIKLLRKKLDSSKFKQYSFAIYNTVYPKNLKLLEEHANSVINDINSLNLDEVYIKRRKSFYVNKQKFTISFHEEQSSNKFIPFIYGEEGVHEEDRKSWFTALSTRIAEKEQKAAGYLDAQPNVLVVYDNSDYGIFLNDVQEEVNQEIDKIVSNRFKQIWLLKGVSVSKLW